MNILFLILLVALVASLIPMTFLFLRAYARYGGTRQVLCPSDRKPARVRLDAIHAAWTSIMEERDLRVARCSQWPARKDCGGKCVPQLTSSPGLDRSAA